MIIGKNVIGTQIEETMPKADLPILALFYLVDLLCLKKYSNRL